MRGDEGQPPTRCRVANPISRALARARRAASLPHSLAHPSRVSRTDTAMALARAFYATPTTQTRVVSARVARRRLSASPARRARLVARNADGYDVSVSLPEDSVGDGTAETGARPELLFEPPPVPRPAAAAPPADLAPLADALEPPLEPEPPLELPQEPEPFPPTLAEDVEEDAFPEADDAASSTGSRASTLPDPPSAAPGRATRGARPILGRLALCRNDPSLAPYEGLLKARYDLHESRYDEIVRNEGSLGAFAESYKRYGIHPDVSPHAKPGDVTYVEYAPGANRLSLMGDFNEWTPWEFEGEKDAFGNWTVKIPAAAGLRHGAAVRVAMETSDGSYFDRIPAWIRQIAPCEDEGANYHNGVYYDPPPEERHEWRHEKIIDDPDASSHPSSLRIYEAHVGMSSEAHGYGTYREFADTHLRRIADLGYSAVQLMAVADHAYYASFGYQVTNFFAPAHRSGSPEDLKYLVDAAHGLGMKVLMDVVHAHASDNAIDGLNAFDGTSGHYFHEDPGLGWHKLWGTRMFAYGKYETLRFLLSNLRYWSEEFRFDGFRFDGVTAMLYTHRGVHWDFLGGQSEFYGHHADDDACAYLMLANRLLREECLDPRVGASVVTIAEDVSGQTGVCRPVWHGGLGFNLRLSMGPPDKWAQLAREPDFNWSPSRVLDLVTNRSPEPAVAYLESHDQCLVGDKTFAFNLMDGAMYECMSKSVAPTHPAIERGVALHKMARLLTLALGGEAWMAFMGNEFGHPEWVDFPREGNGFSFQHARRQWSLRENQELFYADLERFDGGLMQCDARHGLLRANERLERKTAHHVRDDAGVLAFHCGKNLVVCNLHPHESYPYYKVGSEFGGTYELVLDTDATAYGGYGRLGKDTRASTENGACDWQSAGVCLYLPSRSAQVYALVEEWDVPEPDAWGVHYDNDYGYGNDDYDTGGGGDDAVWF